MGTRLKSFKYHPINKLIAIILVIVAACSFIDVIAQYALLDYYKIENQNYFETEAFKNNFIMKTGYVRDWIVRYNDNAIFYGETEEVIQARKEYFEKMKVALEKDNSSFFYYAKDTQTGDIITNIPSYYENPDNEEKMINEIVENPYGAVGNLATLDIGDGSYRYQNYYQGELLSDEEINRYQIYAYVDENYLEQNAEKDIFSVLKKGFDEEKNIAMLLRSEEKQKQLNQNVVVIGGGLLAILYLCYSAGRSSKKEEITWTIVDRIPFEIQAIILVFFAILSLLGLRIFLNDISFINDIAGHIVLTKEIGIQELIGERALYSIWVADVLLGLTSLLSMVRHIKNRSFLNNTLIGSFCKWCFESLFTQGALPIVFLIIGIGAVGLNILLLGAAVAARSVFFVGYIFMFNVIFIMICSKFIWDFRKIAIAFKKIAKGDIHYKVEVHATLPAIKELAYDMNHVREGLEEAAAEIAKKERMKAELITNVSHDLKTPLTSIISYIDLLKAEEVKNEKVTEYIDVLGERSERLKHLIEDLIEASKASTGNMKTEAEIIGLDQLIEQVVGEYTDRFHEASLEVIFSKMEEVNIVADPRHMWRVTENLLSNIMKYTMPYTRVYIEVKKENEKGVFIFRNISREAIKVDAKDLTERFVQGDESRSKEGSGLGLAIASSLVNLQKGDFEITIDGDLFKVQVSMPLEDIKREF